MTSPISTPAVAAKRTSTTPPATRARSSWLTAARVMPALVLVVLVAIVAIIEPAFIPGGGISVMILQAVPLIFLATGQMLAILVGGIDLSNAALAVLSAIMVAKMLGPVGAAAPIVVIAIAGVLGAMTGGITGYFQVPTFAVTLGAMGVWQAAALLLSNQTTVSAAGQLGPIEWLLNYRFLGLEIAIWLALSCAGVFWLIIRRTVLGQTLRAVGLNERASVLAGANRLGARIFVYAASGVLASLAGIFLTAQQGAATATGAGTALLLPSIAAAIVGGCAVTGGIANPFNVVIGAFIITLIPIGTAAIGIGPSVQSLIFGLIIIVSVIASTDRRRRSVNK